MERKKIAIYIDYALRTPNFNASYEAFRTELFSDKSFDLVFDTEEKENLTGPQYWQLQMADKEIEKFYMNAKLLDNDYDYCSGGFASYFYNIDHFVKFLDEYSYNLYTDCEVPNKQDIDIINIAQTELFDVVLIDTYVSRRKKSHTFYYLTRNSVYPKSIVFLNDTDVLDGEYIGVWNPKFNKDQRNGKGNKSFLDWLKLLEETYAK